MSLRPASVDPQGGPITGNGGGPMPLAKSAATWSHVAGKRHPPITLDLPWWCVRALHRPSPQGTGLRSIYFDLKKST